MHKISPIVRGIRTLDAQTFDTVINAPDQYGNHQGVALGGRFRTHDASPENNYRTVDSTGAFLIGELERLDLTLNEPLVEYTWSRDVDLREDVTIADEVSSFTQSSFASSGSLGTGNGIRNGKAWIGKVTDQIVGVGLDIAKIPQPLRPWGIEVKYTTFELASSAKVGRPIDEQKYAGMQLKYNMDVDEQVYVGDASMGDGGLFNAPTVTNVQNLGVGAGGDTEWSTKTPAEILADINGAITDVWTASAFAVKPNRILIPPAQYAYLSSQLVSGNGSTSILKFLLDNNIVKNSGSGTLDIMPAKWGVGAGAGGTIGTTGTVDRMVVYSKDKKRVRFPMTMLNRTPVQYDSIYMKTTYYCRIGVLEVIYPETIGYFDGL